MFASMKVRTGTSAAPAHSVAYTRTPGMTRASAMWRTSARAIRRDALSYALPARSRTATLRSRRGPTRRAQLYPLNDPPTSARHAIG